MEREITFYEIILVGMDYMKLRRIRKAFIAKILRKSK